MFFNVWYGKVNVVIVIGIEYRKYDLKLKF